MIKSGFASAFTQEFCNDEQKKIVQLLRHHGNISNISRAAIIFENYSGLFNPSTLVASWAKTEPRVDRVLAIWGTKLSEEDSFARLLAGKKSATEENEYMFEIVEKRIRDCLEIASDSEVKINNLSRLFTYLAKHKEILNPLKFLLKAIPEQFNKSKLVLEPWTSYDDPTEECLLLKIYEKEWSENLSRRIEEIYGAHEMASLKESKGWVQIELEYEAF